MSVRRLRDVPVTRSTYEAWKKFAEGPDPRFPRKGKVTLAPIPSSWRVYRFRIVPDDRPLDLSFLHRS